MKVLQLFTLVFIITTFSCDKKAVDNDFVSNLPPDQLEVSDIEGSIGFWTQGGVDKYTINVSIPETIDGLVTGLVDNMPEDFRTENLRVIFSGKYEESSDNPQPIYGGQSVYSLSLSSIRTK